MWTESFANWKPLGRAIFPGLLLLGLALVPPASASAQVGGPSGSSGDEGTPVLVVTGYSTDPTTVPSGDDFSLTVTLQNVGTKHADGLVISVDSNGQFVGLGSPAQVDKIDPEFSATVTLRAQAASLSTGAYDLNLRILYRIGESAGYETVRTVGIQVQAASGVTGRPQVVIADSEVSAADPANGAFTLTLTLQNVGARRALDVSAALKLNENLSPAQGSGTAQVGSLGAGETTTLTIPMTLNDPETWGRLTQTFTLSYTDSDDAPYSHDETVSLEVSPGAGQQPLLLVAAYTASPAQPAPGQSVTLSLQIKNVGAGEARQVVARLGDEEGLAPFAPQGSSNVSFVERIGPGETVTLSWDLLVDGAATGGAYPLKVILDSENLAGEAQSESEIISLVVMTQPQLQFTLTEPVSETLQVGDAFEIPVEVINIGRQRLEVSTIEVVGEGLELTDNAEYVGPLDPSISGTVNAQAVAAASGTVSARVIVHYRDDLNQPQTVEHEFTFQVGGTQGAAPDVDSSVSQGTPAADPPGFWARVWTVLRGMLGIGS